MLRYEARQWFLNGTLIGFRVERGHGPRLEIAKAFPFEHGAYATREEVRLTEALAVDMAAAANRIIQGTDNE